MAYAWAGSPQAFEGQGDPSSPSSRVGDAHQLGLALEAAVFSVRHSLARLARTSDLKR